jgi:hypothetical protein
MAHDQTYRRCLRGGLAVMALTTCAMVAISSPASAAKPRCPAGSAYNKHTKKCTVAPTLTCPQGSTLDTAGGMCVAEASPTCPDGLTYDPGNRWCQAVPTCPPGYVLVEYGECYDSTTGLYSAHICPPDTSYDWHYPFCVGAPDPTATTCADGLTYNPTSGQCEAAPTATCPRRFTLSRKTNMCEARPRHRHKPPRHGKWWRAPGHH